MKKLGKMALSFALILTMTTTIAFAGEGTQSIKEENVYGVLKANGETDHIIVSNHIQKEKDVESVSITSELENVKMLMDDITYEEGSATLEFTTDESDIYYQGTTTKVLPVTTKITYYLDGQEILASELAGQSGHLKMVIQQENNEKRTITVDGERREIYVPFETALVVDMDNDIYENVAVSSGKVIDDGSVKVLSAVLMPGLQESLEDIESDKIVDQVTLEADVTDFELKPIYMTTICKLPDINIAEQLGELNDVEGQLDEFKDAGADLVDGANQLNDGVSTYFGKQSEAFNLFNSYLENDQKLLSSVVAFDGSLTEFNTGLAAYTEGVNQVVGGVAKLCESTPQLVEGMTALNGALSQALPNNEQTAPIFNLIAQLEAGLTGVDEGLQQVNMGALALTEKTPLIAGGSAKLTEGAHQLAAGAGELIKANGQLGGGLIQLSDASTQVTDGSAKLADGVSEFKTKGVDELSNKIEESIDRINHFNEAYEKVYEIAEEYNNFTGTTDEFESSVIFILKTEGIN